MLRRPAHPVPSPPALTGAVSTDSEAFANLVGGVYQVAHQPGAASFVEIPIGSP